MITIEQFAEWKEHPITKEIFSSLEEMKQKLVEKLVEGQTISEKAEKTHGYTNKIVGQIEGINQLLNISFADDDNESENKEQNEVSAY